MAYDNFLVDKRVVDRNIKKGIVDPDQLKQQIEALPDRESNCVHVSLDGSTQSADAADFNEADDVDAADDEADDLDDEDSDDEDSDDEDSDDADDDSDDADDDAE